MLARCWQSSSLARGLTAALLDALDAVLDVGVQLPQAVNDIIGRLPVAAPVGLQESGDLTEGSKIVSLSLHRITAADGYAGERPSDALSQQVNGKRW